MLFQVVVFSSYLAMDKETCCLEPQVVVKLDLDCYQNDIKKEYDICFTTPRGEEAELTNDASVVDTISG